MRQKHHKGQDPLDGGSICTISENDAVDTLAHRKQHRQQVLTSFFGGNTRQHRRKTHGERLGQDHSKISKSPSSCTRSFSSTRSDSSVEPIPLNELAPNKRDRKTPSANHGETFQHSDTNSKESLRDTHIHTSTKRSLVEREQRSPHSNQTKKKRMTQLFLDCGQSKFGQQLCSLCGMLYMPGIQEDVKAHKKFCLDATSGMRWTPQRINERVHWGSTSSSISFTDLPRWLSVTPSWSGPSAPSPAIVQKIVQIQGASRIKSIVHQLRSLIEEFVAGDVGIDVNTAIEHCILRCTVWMFLYKNRVVGIVSTRAISQAYHVPDYTAEVSRESTRQSCQQIHAGSSEIGRQVSEPKEALLGIMLLWTHKSFRRKGIAAALVDTARRRAFFHLEVPRSKVAFSSPTHAGWAFGSAFCGMQGQISHTRDGERASPLVFDLVKPLSS